MSQARYLMIGGFLGAGKTTAVLRLAQRLTDSGLRVGLITNDQSFGLVDTATLGAHGFPVEEITGGCFCCRFNSLVTAADRLTEAARPDVFIAEPVGSCTDLKATVDYPLRRMYGDHYSVAPLSVMVDPIRALRILGLEPGKSFSPKVTYIYEKQLEEADLIVVNKIDLLEADRVQTLVRALRERFPRSEVLCVSAREGAGTDEWLERLTTGSARTAESMEVDYDLYAEGEALLGWLNATLRLEADDEVDGNALLLRLAQEIQARVQGEGGEIAHLKLTLTPDEDGRDLGVVNAVRGDRPAEASHLLQEPVASGEVILNLRAEADPERLKEIVGEVLRGEAGLSVEHLESFRPGRPVPTHRLAAV
ncbi:MAG: GTP-binding protein [Armatimonadota bacterium]